MKSITRDIFPATIENVIFQQQMTPLCLQGILLPFGRQYGTDFEESQVIIWLSVVSAACKDLNSSTLQLEAQESLGDIVDTSAMSSSFSVSSSGSLHPHCWQGSRQSASALECLEPGRCIT